MGRGYYKGTTSGKHGFTIVELLIVIVVIAILAAITIVAYNGIQQRARNSQRLEDIQTIAKALEMYYIDNGQFPAGQCSSNCSINPSWSTTADGSWQNLANKLVPKYLSSLPSDPTSTHEDTGITPFSDANAYDYSYVGTGSYCGYNGATYQVYLLNYRLEGSSQTQTESLDDCPVKALGPYSGSNLRVVK